jgi:hypothetical protein
MPCARPSKSSTERPARSEKIKTVGAGVSRSGTLAEGQREISARLKRIGDRLASAPLSSGSLRNSGGEALRQRSPSLGAGLRGIRDPLLRGGDLPQPPLVGESFHDHAHAQRETAQDWTVKVAGVAKRREQGVRCLVFEVFPADHESAARGWKAGDGESGLPWQIPSMGKCVPLIPNSTVSSTGLLLRICRTSGLCGGRAGSASKGGAACAALVGRDTSGQAVRSTLARPARVCRRA